jgi:hypothetical protein
LKRRFRAFLPAAQSKTLCATLQQWGASPEDLAPLLRMVRAIVVSNAVHRAETDREPHRVSFAAALEPLKVRRQLLERFFGGHGMIFAVRRLSRNALVGLGAMAPSSLPAVDLMHATQIAKPFHCEGWVYEEKPPGLHGL